MSDYVVAFKEKPASPEDILHYGVKGMRWGVRKDKSSGGRSSTKESFSRKLAKGQIDEAIKTHQQARDKEGLIGVLSVLDRNTWGRGGRYEKYQNARISELERGREMVDGGKLVVTTILLGPQYVSSTNRSYQKFKNSN